MNQISIYVASPLLAILNLLVMHKCMDSFFSYKKQGNVGNTVLWICYYLFQTMLGFSHPFSPAMIMAINALFVLLLTSLSYRGNLKHYLSFSVMVCCIWMLVELLLYFCIGIFGIKDHFDLAGAVISKMAMFLLAVISNKIMKKDTQNIPPPYMVILVFVPAGSIYIMHNLFLISEHTGRYSEFSFFASILLLLINYTIFEVYDWLAQKAAFERKTMLYEQQLELCNSQAEEREKSYQEIRHIRHDMKDYLAVLAGMLQEGKTEEIALYLHDIQCKIADCCPNGISRSGNIVVDTLVNYKYALACREGISFHADILLPARLPFQAGHLTIILGNLLENALDACRELQEGEGYIELEAFYAKGMLTLTTKNPYKGNRQKNQTGKFVTTKKDIMHHGLGFSSVERALEPYHGQIIAEGIDGIFHTIVIMYEESGDAFYVKS